MSKKYVPKIINFTDNSPPTGEDNKKWYDKIVNTILFPYICKIKIKYK